MVDLEGRRGVGCTTTHEAMTSALIVFKDEEGTATNETCKGFQRHPNRIELSGVDKMRLAYGAPAVSYRLGHSPPPTKDSHRSLKHRADGADIGAPCAVDPQGAAQPRFAHG